MGSAGGNKDGIAGSDIGSLVSENHYPLSPGNMIDFIAFQVPVQLRCPSNRDYRFCKALFQTREDIRMQQLTDFRTVFCDGGLNIGIFSLCDHMK